MRAFWAAVSVVNGGSGGRLMAGSPGRRGRRAAGRARPAGRSRSWLASGGGAMRGDDREVDHRLGDFIDVVGPGVQGDMQHDFDDLRVVVTGQLDGADIVLLDMPAL